MVSAIVARGIDVTEGNQRWFEIGAAFANAMGEEGRGFYHLVSQFHEKYSPRETDRQYDACLKKGMGTRLGRWCTT